MSKKIVVIGAGAAGLSVSIGLAKIGHKVTVVEKHKIGGDCTHYGCVPSKALLYRAQNFRDFKDYNSQIAYQVSNSLLKDQANRILNQTRAIVQGFAEHESPNWLASYGIEVIAAKARFVSKNQLQILDLDLANSVLKSYAVGQLLTFDYAVIASGGRPRIPQIKGLQDTPYLTNYNIFDLEQVPDSLAILGNGAIGAEMAQAFLNLGSKVTMIGRGDYALSRPGGDISARVHANFLSQGLDYLNLKTDKISYDKFFKIRFESGKEVTAQALMVATGRDPNLDLGLELAGVESSAGGIKVNDFARTKNSRIYAIGDCCDVPKFTHFANHMAKKVVMNLAVKKYFWLPDIFRFRPFILPAVTYIQPEIAQAGMTLDQAKAKYKKIKVLSLELAQDSDRMKTQTIKNHKIEIITVGILGRIVGVNIMADRAGEMLPEFQRLIQSKAHFWSLGKIIRAYPTYLDRLSSLVIAWFYQAYET